MLILNWCIVILGSHVGGLVYATEIGISSSWDAPYFNSDRFAECVREPLTGADGSYIPIMTFPSFQQKECQQGDFEYLSELIKSRSTIVHHIRHKASNRGFVLKQILKNGEFLVLARNEECILGSLYHPSIVRHYCTLVMSDGSIGLVLEFVNRHDLFAMTYSNPPVALPKLSLMIGQLADVLHFIHRNDIIHRDIKLENILVDENGHVKLIDFGLAAYAPDGIASGVVGTLKRLAPEVRSGSWYTKTVDWYGLGLMIFEMVYRHVRVVRKDPKFWAPLLCEHSLENMQRVSESLLILSLCDVEPILRWGYIEVMHWLNGSIGEIHSPIPSPVRPSQGVNNLTERDSSSISSASDDSSIPSYSSDSLEEVEEENGGSFPSPDQ